MTFELRPATGRDAAAIRGLVFGARLNPGGLDWRRFLVATSPQGKVIGCGQIKPHRDGSHELASLVVAPEWRGQGVARALMEGLVDTHPGDLYLMCQAKLGVFYARFGFQPLEESEMPRYLRRVSRLADLAGFLFAEGDRLLVMHRPGDSQR